MVFKHPIQALKEDLDKVIEHGRDQILELMKGNQKDKTKKMKDIMDSIQEKISGRTQVELQRQQRKETEDAVFIQGESIKNKDQAQDLVIDTLKKKFKDKEIGRIVKAEQIVTQRKDKLLFKVQLRPKNQQEVSIERDGKEHKVSLTTALFAVLRNQNDQKKKNKVDVQRQTPAYLQNLKKKMDLITRDMRLNYNYQTKTGFNVKSNTLVAKFRKEKSDKWTDILENTDQLPDDIQEKLEEIDWVNYVVYENDFIKNITKF